jgi:acetylornithine aminotransferase
MNRTEELAGRWSAVMLGNYRTPPVALARGEGATVWDVDGRAYTDLLAASRRRSSATRTRASSRRSPGRRRPSAVSNLAMHEPGVLLAERLLELAGRPGRVFFCNSGAEANEAAFKIAG